MLLQVAIINRNYDQSRALSHRKRSSSVSSLVLRTNDSREKTISKDLLKAKPICVMEGRHRSRVLALTDARSLMPRSVWILVHPRCRFKGRVIVLFPSLWSKKTKITLFEPIAAQNLSSERKCLERDCLQTGWLIVTVHFVSFFVWEHAAENNTVRTSLPSIDPRLSEPDVLSRFLWTFRCLTSVLFMCDAAISCFRLTKEEEAAWNFPPVQRDVTDRTGRQSPTPVCVSVGRYGFRWMLK